MTKTGQAPGKSPAGSQVSARGPRTDGLDTGISSGHSLVCYNHCLCTEDAAGDFSKRNYCLKNMQI